MDAMHPASSMSVASDPSEISNVSTSSLSSNGAFAMSALSSSSSHSRGQRKNSAERCIAHTRMEEEDLHKEYNYTGVLGEGSFGKVYKAQHVNSDETVAIKEIVKEKAGSSGLRQLEKEVSIFKRVNHKNIIQLREVIESSKKMYLIMELCKGGDLAGVLKKQGAFSEEETKIVMSNLSEAIKYLHQLGILHRDLKLENILIAEEFQDRKDIKIKVSDFGLSTQQTNNSFDSMQEQYCGTPSYMAPEMNSTYSFRVDVWAMGIIMYYLLTQYPKDNGPNESICKNGPKFEEPQWKAVSEQAKDLLQAMLVRNPAYRLSAGEVLNHEWFTGKKKEHGNVLELMKEYRQKKIESEASSSSDSEQSSAINRSKALTPTNVNHNGKQQGQKVESSSKFHTTASGTKSSPEGTSKLKTASSSSSKKLPAKSSQSKKTLKGPSKNALTPKTKKH